MPVSVIRTLRFHAIAAAVAKPYGMAKGLATARQSTIVVIETADGIQGVGEAWGPPAANMANLGLLKGYVEGRDVADIELIFQLIIARHYHFGIQNQLMACLSGIDMAAKDALGKQAGLPLCRLIGGRGAERVPVYASGGYITEDVDKDFAPQIELIAKGGHRAAKIKIGLDPASDEKRVKLARDILGDSVALLVDINANYTLDIAKVSIGRIAPYHIGWVEEPLAPQDFDGYELLQRSSPIPIATGEALYTAFDFKRLLDRRGADVVQPDLSLAGGFWQGRRIADLAELAHVRLSPHVWGSGIGLAAAAHYVASRSPYPHADNIPHPTLVEYDMGENPLRESILQTPLVAGAGMIDVPSGAGLGIEIDWKAVKRYAID